MTYNPNAPYNIEKQVLKKSLFSIISRIRHPEAFMNDKRVVLIFDFQVFILFGSILQLLFNKFKSNLYLNKSGVLWYPPKRKKTQISTKVHPFDYEDVQRIKYFMTWLTINIMAISKFLKCMFDHVSTIRSTTPFNVVFCNIFRPKKRLYLYSID